MVQFSILIPLGLHCSSDLSMDVASVGFLLMFMMGTHMASLTFVNIMSANHCHVLLTSCGMVGLLLMIFNPLSVTLTWPAVILIGLSWCRPCINVFVKRESSIDERLLDVLCRRTIACQNMACVFAPILSGIIFQKFGWWALVVLLGILQAIHVLLAIVYTVKVKRDDAVKDLKDQEDGEGDDDDDDNGAGGQPTSWITYVVILAFAVNELGLTVLMGDMGTYYSTVLQVDASIVGCIHGVSNAIGVIFLLSLDLLPKGCALGRPLNLFAAVLACVVSLLVFTIPAVPTAVIGHALYVISFVCVCTTANTGTVHSQYTHCTLTYTHCTPTANTGAINRLYCTHTT
jgi:hypothetical protein